MFFVRIYLATGHVGTFPTASVSWSPLSILSQMLPQLMVCPPQRTGGQLMWGLNELKFSSLLWSIEWKACGAQSLRQLRIPVLRQQGNLLLGSPCSNWCAILFPADWCWGYVRTSDGGSLANSALGQTLKSGKLQLPADLSPIEADHRGLQAHVFVADDAFHQAFPGHIFSRARRIFNYCLARTLPVVENAFGILSSQWRMYRRAIELQPEVAEKWMKTPHNCSEDPGWRWSHIFEELLPITHQKRPTGWGRPSHPPSLLKELFHGKTPCNAQAHPKRLFYEPTTTH